MVFGHDDRDWPTLYHDMGDAEVAAGYHALPARANQYLQTREATRLTPLIERHAGPGTRVLDLACGTGNHVQAWNQQGLQAIGVDLCQPPLRSGHGHVQASATHLPFKNDAYETITISGLLYDLNDLHWQWTLEEATRVASHLILLRIYPRTGDHGRFTFRGLSRYKDALHRLGWRHEASLRIRDRPPIPSYWACRLGLLLPSPERWTIWTPT